MSSSTPALKLAGSWSSTNTGVVTSTEAHSGLYSYAAFGGEDAIQSFFPTIDTSAITELSLWAKRDGGLFDFVQFTYSDSSTEVNFINTLGGSSDWTYVI